MLIFQIYIIHVSQQVAGISWMPCGMLRLFCCFVFVFLDSCFRCDAAAWAGYCCYKVKEEHWVQSFENEKWLWDSIMRRVLVQLHWHLRYLGPGQGISVFQFWMFLYVHDLLSVVPGPVVSAVAEGQSFPCCLWKLHETQQWQSPRQGDAVGSLCFERGCVMS